MALSRSASSPNLELTVQRHEPELIAPAKPTPHELKYLSDIDDQEELRFLMPGLLFYRNNISMVGRDPVNVIRKAIAEALVFYYPFAGRLREGPGRKLVVDCTDEGIIFIEADANVRLDQFGDTLQPPFPFLKELLYDVPGSEGVLNCPLLLIQVTRLLCGGFIFGLRFNHTMCDAQGFAQFLSAVGEIARGAPYPSVQPVWQRELLTFAHQGIHVVPDNETNIVLSPPNQDENDDQIMVHGYFTFGHQQLASLRKHVPPHLSTCSIFELLTACIWKCRTIAINPNPDDKVIMICTVDARGKIRQPLPVGFYGNALALAVAVSNAKELCHNPLGYALEQVKGAKKGLKMNDDDYGYTMRSWAGVMMMKGRPDFSVGRSYLVSDLTRVRFWVDLGWGKPICGGPAKGDVGPIPGVGSFYIPFFRNNKGEKENAIMVPICLPRLAMEKFVAQLKRMMHEGSPIYEIYTETSPKFIVSPL